MYIFRRKCTRAHAKIASNSQILKKYSVISRKKLVKARVSLRASVKLNLSCTISGHTHQYVSIHVIALVKSIDLILFIVIEAYRTHTELGRYVYRNKTRYRCKEHY